MRNVQGKVSKAAEGIVTASVRSIFSQPVRKSAIEQLERISETLKAKYPQVADMLDEAEEDIVAYMHFPEAHWRQIRSTNLLDRLIGMVLVEQNDKWQLNSVA